LTSGAFWAVVHAPSPGLLLLAYLAFGFASMLFAFNFAHDFSHQAVFKHRFWDNLGYTVLYTMMGAHAEAWKHRHVHSHHYAPNVKDYDTDLQITNWMRVEPSAPLRWYHRWQHIYAPLAYATYSLYWITWKDGFVYMQDFRSGKLGLGYHLSFWAQKLVYFGYLLTIPLALSPVDTGWVILAFLLMHAAQSVFLLFTFFITHHVEATEYFDTDAEGYIRTSWINNQLRSSNDFFPFSRLANHVFGGFNNHIAHHLYPHIHHVHYPRLNRILYRELTQAGYSPNQTTFFGGVRSHLRHLKEMGQPEAVAA
ncbi:MAG TPA: hypothetical protein DCP28_16305, partial [Cytophagales bacterium]|nr:hypothetical protein [Cytophagales bacterium]